MADSVTQSTPAGSAELLWGLEQWVHRLEGSGLISCPVVPGDHRSHQGRNHHAQLGGGAKGEGLGASRLPTASAPSTPLNGAGVLWFQISGD